MTTIKAWMTMLFCQIQQLTTELAALECPKNQGVHLFLVALDLILCINLQIWRKCIIFWMYSNFSQIGRQTTELPALEHPKNTPIWVIMGKMVSTVFWLLLTGELFKIF